MKTVETYVFVKRDTANQIMRVTALTDKEMADMSAKYELMGVGEYSTMQIDVPDDYFQMSITEQDRFLQQQATAKVAH
ncbi:MAG: hypothetical protein PHF58_10585 [Methylotenera sp.]|nr:hypothetical protein [Methylotenera sp.]